METSHLIVCDDEPDLREMVGEYLGKRGYKISLAENGGALEHILQNDDTVSGILLDINMPGEDGLTILRKIRAERDIAVIMLTGAGETIDKIVGLEMGADDYLGKPVDLRELEARIKAVMRRSEKKAEEVPTAPGIKGKMSFAGFTINFDSTNLSDPEGNDVPLTAMEFRLLKVFAENRGRVLNRDQLLELAHDRGWDPFDRSIDIRILRLRKKIEKNPSKPEIIRTVRGIGYVFDPQSF